MYTFDYARPATVADAAKALAANPEARLLAGGQTLIPTLKQRLAAPSALIDLGGIGELKAIRRDGDIITIGALVTHDTVARNSVVNAAIPALAQLANGIGDAQVRNAGTIGGSVANNDPAADYPSALLALGATVVTSKRQIPAEQYFTGMFSTALEPTEIITAVQFPVPKRAGYAKYAQRASRYVLVGVFVAETAAGVRCAVNGCGADGVFRSAELETALAKSFSADAVKGVAIAPAGLMGDMHGSAEYRAAMVPVMAARAVVAAK
jgi:aerobic carbon-monoxide dehydrogenase medium subunit